MSEKFWHDHAVNWMRKAEFLESQLKAADGLAKRCNEIEGFVEFNDSTADWYKALAAYEKARNGK